MEEYLRVGIISSTHGIKGEVKVFPTTDDVNRFKKLKDVVLVYRGEHVGLEVENTKFSKQAVIVKFKDIDDINEIEKYKGCDILVNRKNAVELEPNENFICDLIDCEVFTDEGKKLGKIKDVMVTGANDVYVVEAFDKEEYLIPVIKECVLDVNVETKKVLVHVLPGLFD